MAYTAFTEAVANALMPQKKSEGENKGLDEKRVSKIAEKAAISAFKKLALEIDPKQLLAEIGASGRQAGEVAAQNTGAGVPLTEEQRSGDPYLPDPGGDPYARPVQSRSGGVSTQKEEPLFTMTDDPSNYAPGGYHAMQKESRGWMEKSMAPVTSRADWEKENKKPAWWKQLIGGALAGGATDDPMAYPKMLAANRDKAYQEKVMPELAEKQSAVQMASFIKSISPNGPNVRINFNNGQSLVLRQDQGGYWLSALERMIARQGEKATHVPFRVESGTPLASGIGAGTFPIPINKVDAWSKIQDGAIPTDTVGKIAYFLSHGNEKMAQHYVDAYRAIHPDAESALEKELELWDNPQTRQKILNMLRGKASVTKRAGGSGDDDDRKLTPAGRSHYWNQVTSDLGNPAKNYFKENSWLITRSGAASFDNLPPQKKTAFTNEMALQRMSLDGNLKGEVRRDRQKHGYLFYGEVLKGKPEEIAERAKGVLAAEQKKIDPKAHRVSVDDYNRLINQINADQGTDLPHYGLSKPVPTGPPKKEVTGPAGSLAKQRMEQIRKRKAAKQK